jgi:hypothetical protein
LGPKRFGCGLDATLGVGHVLTPRCPWFGFCLLLFARTLTEHLHGVLKLDIYSCLRFGVGISCAWNTWRADRGIMGLTPKPAGQRGCGERCVCILSPTRLFDTLWSRYVLCALPLDTVTWSGRSLVTVTTPRIVRCVHTLRGVWVLHPYECR